MGESMLNTIRLFYVLWNDGVNVKKDGKKGKEQGE
jgi:hypothetical protein